MIQKFQGFRAEFLSSVCKRSRLRCCFWPEAEDKALRGRNLSAAFRTLYRQVGEPSQRLPSCAAQPWRVENQCDKSTVRIATDLQHFIDGRPKSLFLKTKIHYQQTATTECPFFPGKPTELNNKDAKTRRGCGGLSGGRHWER